MIIRDVARRSAEAWQRRTTAHLAALAGNPFGIRQYEKNGLLGTRVGVLPNVVWINDVRGVGEGNLPALDEIIAAFVADGPPPMLRVWASVLTPALGAELFRRGFAVAEVSTLLAAEKPTLRSPDGSIEVRRDAPTDVHAELVATGFAPPEEINRRLMVAELGQPDLTRYTAFRKGIPAGGASMLATDEAGFFAGASTLPPFRGQGVQTALIAARFDDLAGRVAVVTTGYATGSQRNLERAGFRLVDVSLSYLWVGLPTS